MGILILIGAIWFGLVIDRADKRRKAAWAKTDWQAFTDKYHAKAEAAQRVNDKIKKRYPYL